MKDWSRMTAAEMRSLGLLWPEDLTDENLQMELAQCNQFTTPLSFQALVVETNRRMRRKGGQTA